MTTLLAILALCLLVGAIGRAIDRADADEALRNGVALLVQPLDEREIADNLDI